MGSEAVVDYTYVVEQVKRIRSMAYDDEAAHSMEDELWFNVLMAIASSKVEYPDELAKEALRTRDIKFERWCA